MVPGIEIPGPYGAMIFRTWIIQIPLAVGVLIEALKSFGSFQMRIWPRQENQ
jgi:hypothetical protein